MIIMTVKPYIYLCLDSLLKTKQIQSFQRSSSFKENSASTSIPQRGTSVVKPYRPPEERKQSKNNSRLSHVYVNLSSVLFLCLKCVYFLNPNLSI